MRRTKKQTATNDPDDGSLRAIVVAARAAGEATVRLVLARRSKPSPMGTVRLWATRGPSSSEDHPVTRLDHDHIAATFRVADLDIYLRAKERRCYAIGCELPCPLDHLMCTRHWAQVPARFQVAVYRAKAKVNFDDAKVRCEWVSVAERAIGWVAVLEGKISAEDAARRLAEAGEPDGRVGTTFPRDPFAVLDAARAR